MKKTRLILPALAVLTCNAFAQLSAVDYKNDDFAQFKSNKTYVVKTGDANFDSEMASVMTGEWKITSFDFVDKKDFGTKIKDKTASFILPITIETGTPNQNYHYLALINGGKKNLDKYTYDDMLAYAVINHWGSEPNNIDCSYRVRNMVESMIDAMTIVQKNDIKGNSKNIAMDLLAYYRTKSTKVKDRTLLIPDYMISKKLDKAKFAGMYPFKYEICTKEKIAEAIKNKSSDYYYFQPTVTLNKSMWVIDPSNGEVIYGNVKVMGLYVKDDDIEELVNAIKGKK